MRKNVKVKTNPVANERSAPNERVIEFDGPTGTGGLIAFRCYDDGSVFVELFKLDPGVHVTVRNRYGVSVAVQESTPEIRRVTTC